MITLEDYFDRMSRVANEEPSPEIRANAEGLLNAVNALLRDPAMKLIGAATNPVVNSGWRTIGYNASIPNAAPRSRHMTGEAIDLADPDGELDDALFYNQDLLKTYALWMEHPLATKGWTHLQSAPPRSGNRVFMP